MKTKHVTYLLALPVCAALTGYLLSPRIMAWISADMRRTYSTLRAEETLLHVGFAAMKYEYCFESPPSGIDDLIQSGLVVTGTEDRDWYVPYIGSISGAIARRLTFHFEDGDTPLASGEVASVPWVGLQGVEEGGKLSRIQMRLADMRSRFRQGLPTGEPHLDRWLRDCVGVGRPAGLRAPTSQAVSDGAPSDGPGG